MNWTDVLSVVLCVVNRSRNCIREKVLESTRSITLIIRTV